MVTEVVMEVGRLLESRVLLVTGRRDQRRRRCLAGGVLERELKCRQVVQQRPVVGLGRQVRQLVRHGRRRRFRVLDDPGQGLGPVRFGRRVPGRRRVIVDRLQLQRVHKYRSAVGVHHGGRLFPRRAVAIALVVRRSGHGRLLQRVPLLVVLLLHLLQLAAEGVGDGGVVHDGRRVILHAVIVVVPRRHALAAVRVPAAGRRQRGQRRCRCIRRGRLVVVRLGRRHRHFSVVARRSGVHDFWFGAACAHQ